MTEDEQRTTYVVTVWIDMTIVQDEATPDVFGTIDLTSAEWVHLDTRLTALLDEGFITEYSVTEFTVPEPVSEHAILLAITAPRETEDAQEAAALWHKS